LRRNKKASRQEGFWSLGISIFGVSRPFKPIKPNLNQLPIIWIQRKKITLPRPYGVLEILCFRSFLFVLYKYVGIEKIQKT